MLKKYFYGKRYVLNCIAQHSKIQIRGCVMNKRIPYYLLATIKLLYIVLIFLSLCLLKVAMSVKTGENEYFTYSLIDKFCNDLIVADFLLTGSGLMFIGFFWFLCKTTVGYSLFLWIFTPYLHNFLSSKIFQKMKFLHPLFLTNV